MARYIRNERRPDAFNFTLSIKFRWTWSCCAHRLTQRLLHTKQNCDPNGIGRMPLRTRTYGRIIEFVRISV